jgi:phosphocarrier protein
MGEREVKIINHTGLHTRPAKELVKQANRFKSEITLHMSGKQANAKSFLNVITLGAAKGATLTIRASGEDEVEALETLCALIDNKFGEDE